MSENRFRVPAEELYAAVEVPAADQVQVHAEPEEPATDWRTGPEPWLDGGGGDVDGD